MRSLLGFIIATVACSGCSPAALEADSSNRWVGTWATAIQPPFTPEVEKALKYDVEMGHTLPSAGLENQTMRMVVHTSVGGARLRIRLSNRYGTMPLAVGAASVALRQGGASGAGVTPGSVTGVRFAGATAVTVAPGQEITSDPVGLAIGADQDLVVSVFAPQATGPATWHRLSVSTSYLGRGDLTGAVDGAGYQPVVTPDLSCWFWLAGVEVSGSPARSSVVMLGDSITDGRRSTQDANHRFPDYLARRLGNRLGVLNMGIAGGRVVNDAPCCGASALARLQHDVLDQPNVSDMVLLEGVNDASYPKMPTLTVDDIVKSPLVPVTAAQVNDGFKQIIAAAHAKGIKVIGCTILPFAGAASYTPEGEAMRQEMNAFIRSAPFDAVVDLDALMRDPAQPEAMLADYASMDKLHPNDRGYELMAGAFDPRLFP
jgi:lysophospholipase L1-like esterase